MKNRILSFLLATVMLITFALPVSAQDIVNITDYDESMEDGGEVSAPVYVPPLDDVETPQTEPEDNSGTNESTSEPVKVGEDITDEAALIAQMEAWLNDQRVTPVTAGNGLIAPFSAPGDTGTIVHSTISIRPYDVTVPGVGRAYGSVVWRMKIKGEDAFCLQIWKLAGGTYTAGNATSGNGATAQYIANFMASGRTNTEYVAAQVLVWESLYGNIGIYSQSIQGTSFESAYHALKNASAPVGEVLHWTSSTGGQEIITYATGTPIPPEGGEDEPDPDPEGNPNTHTEVTSASSTRTEVRSNTTYEYSDAIGQVLISKRDNEGKSLDGAIFNIVVEFANGQKGGDSAFEVYNGSRIFTWTHPADDHQPAKVTVTEVRPPDGFNADPTPKTAIVHPTYTRVTKVLTHTITITTTTTTTTVIDIDSGEVLAESSASADAETELDPPVVQEYVDFVEGDRETTLTFVNTPKPCSLTIYKYSKGTYSQALAGAKFRIRYADPSVSAQVWERSTGADGKIVIDPLPSDGTLVIEELEAPANHVMGQVTSWTVTVAKDEQKRVDISNDKVTSLIAYKRDSVTGQLLGGAVIKATLLRSHTEPYESGIVHTVTTEPNTGAAHFTGLIPGEWRIEEVSPPPFYLGTSTVHTVNIYDGSQETVTVAFENDRYSGLTLIKLDSVTGNRLQGAVFSLYQGTEIYSTAFLGDFQSNENGMVIIENLESNQWYTVVEKQAPYGYEIDPDNAVQTVFITPEALEQNLSIIFRNPPKPKLLIQKNDSAGVPLAGAVFRLSKEDSADYIEITTGADGTALIENLSETWYTCWEIKSPSGFLLDSRKHTVELKTGRTTTLVVENKAAPKLTIRKIDEQTLEGIEGVTLRITKEGAAEYQDVTTGKNGIVTIPLADGWYFVQERVAKPGYLLDDTIRTIELKAGTDAELVITNRKKPSLKLVKLCSITKNPLQATFEIKVKNGRLLGTFTTNADTGEVLIDNLEYSSNPLILEISEKRAPDGYLITTETMEVTIGWGENKVIEWYNTPENPIIIYKRDTDGKPIGNTEFLVTTVNGAHVATVKTDRTSGVAVVAGLEPGWFTVRETRTGGDEYILDSTPKQIELKYGSPAVVEFINDRKPTLQITKLNKADNTPMPGVLIRVERMNGERIGDYRTNSAGLITISAEAGWVTVYELETLKGFTLDQTPVNVELKANKTATVQLYNVPLPGLQIRKTCSVSGKPLAGVQYQVSRLNGSIIGTYTTDAQGIIYLDIDEPSVVIAELKTVDGYKLDGVPRTVELAPGELTVISYKNTPYPVFEIVKKDSQSKQPLAGVKYKVFDGNMRELGTFATNGLGRIVLTGMDEGKYYVQEHDASAAGPYILDKTVYEINLHYGKTTKIELYNTKMGTLRLLKTDAETGKPLAGATYLIYDANNNILGEYTTDAHGLIELGNSIEPQKLKVKEIKSPDKYVLDSTIYEVEVKAGATAELTLKNEPMRGTIQIVKKAAAANDITKHKVGAALAGAVFEVVDENLNVVDTITTDSRGMAVTIPLPLEKFALREIVSPEFYLLDGSVFYAEIKKHGDVIKFEVLNEPADIAVTVEKRGDTEAKAGDIIRYDFSNISNAGNIALDEFYLHDALPAEVRLETLSTGKWSERLTYKVMYRTNLKTEYRVWKDKLLTTANNELSVTDLRLAANEYVTDFKLIFGTVEPGFHETEAPYILARVLKEVKHETRIVNKADAGGRVGKEWAYNTDSWVTIAQSKPKKCLPRTGLQFPQTEQSIDALLPEKRYMKQK